MIVKHFELKKKISPDKKFFLLYGNNDGFIKEIIQKNLKPILPNKIFNYEESEILNNIDNFKEDVLNKSFFENEKLIIISRTTDKIYKIVEDFVEKNIEDVSIILISNALDKKSKLRNFFEKSKDTVCIPVYEDNHQSLGILAQNFLKEKKISLSMQNINLIIDRCRGNRANLINELEKLENFSKNKKNIEMGDILKLTNLSENYDFNELVDNTLAKNQKKTLYILNENNFASEETILILRIFINKLKRLLKIHTQVVDKNIDEVITNYRPPIFWKEKDIVKKQVKILNYDKIQKLIVKVNNIELLVKKHPSLSINIVTDFILNQAIEVNS